MEELMNLRNELEIVQADSEIENVSAFDPDFSLVECGFDERKKRIKAMFDQVLEIFLKEMTVEDCSNSRPLPVLCPDDGMTVDLFKLFLVVSKLGGCDLVTRKSLWGFVAKECGLGFGVIASVKLIYIKYLDEFHRWLKRVFSNGSLEDGRSAFVKKLELLVWKEEKEAKFDHTSRLLLCSSGRDSNEVDDFAERRVNDDGNLCLDNGNDSSRSVNLVIRELFKELHELSEPKALSGDRYSNGEGTDSQKRKREISLLPEMLNWLSYAAKHSNNPAVGIVPECSKWKDEGDEEFWHKVLLVREALMIKRHVNSNVEESSQQVKKCRMYPSMYEDILNHQSADKSRCSQRLSVAKSQTCFCCKPVPETKVAGPEKADRGNFPKGPPVLNVDSSTGNKPDHLLMEEEPCEKHVSIGPRFQAEVPEWTGEVSESDSKWLGEQMWPPEDANDEMMGINLDAIWKGEAVTCNCLFPKTTECIRFHIAEKRLKLKRELGPLFYKWGFNRMGEEVSLSWTREEEEKFEDMIKLHSSSTNKFWNNASKIFPSKTREMLVSYYFNVFLIRRRSYQNRVTPKDIDSDDDEKELGSVGDRFGYRSVYVPKSKLPICIENKQIADLE